MEAGIVVQMVPVHGDGGKQKILPVGHERSERIRPQFLLLPEGRFPGHEGRPLDRAQAKFRKTVHFRIEEGALELDIPFLPVQLGNFAHDFPVAVDVGSVELDTVVAIVTADIYVRRGSCRRERGEGQVILVPDDGAPDPGGDDFPVAFDGGLAYQPYFPGNRFQETLRSVFPAGRNQVVLVIDGQAQGSGGPAIVQVQYRWRIPGKAGPHGQFHGAFRCRLIRRQGFVSRFVQDFHATGHPCGGGSVEDGEQPGPRQIGRPFLGRIDRRIGDEAVGSGGSCDRNSEGTGAPALQQAYFGRTDRSVRGNEFQVGNSAFGRKKAVSVQNAQGAPDLVSGDVHRPVGGHIDPFHPGGGSKQAAEGQQNQGYRLFHSVSLQKSGFSSVPPAAVQS